MAWYTPTIEVSEPEVVDQVFASVRSSLFSTAGLSMGKRRMTAFPYEMLRKTRRTRTRPEANGEE